MPGIESRNRREPKRKVKQVEQHDHGNRLPKSLEPLFLRLVAQELRMVPCKCGHKLCRGTYRDDDHFDAWQEAFHELWSTMEKMTDVPEDLLEPLAKVRAIQRQAPPVEEQEGPRWDGWTQSYDVASYELLLALAQVDGRCKECLRKAIAAFEL